MKKESTMTANAYPVFKAKEGCCEEASSSSHDFYIPCNAPAVKIMFSKADDKEYRMCWPCAGHNTRRGMIEVRELDTHQVEGKPETVKSSTVPAKFNITDTAIAEMAKKYNGIVATDPKSYKVLRAAITDVAGRRIDIEKRRKELKAPLLKDCANLDAEAKRITLAIAKIEDGLVNERKKYDAEIEEIKQKAAVAEQARMQKIKKRLNFISELTKNAIFLSSEDLLKRQAIFVENYIEKDDFDYQESMPEAEKVKFIVKTQFEEAIELVKKEEERKKQLAIDEAALAEKTKKLEEEQKLLEEAQKKTEKKEADAAAALKAADEIVEAAAQAETAKAEAETAKAEAEKQAEGAKIEAQRQAKEAEAQHKADQEAAVQRERDKFEAEAERTRQAEVSRAADVVHKANVDAQIVKALLELGLGNVVAVNVVELMASGSMPFVTINY